MDQARTECKQETWRKEDLFQAIAEHSREGFVAASLDGRIFFANQSALALYGYTQAEILNMSFSQLAAPQCAAEEFLCRAGEGRMYRSTHQRKRGQLFPVEVSLRGIRLGAESAVLCAVRDISEEARLEKELQETCVFSDALVRTANVMIFLLDKEGRILLFNETAQKMTGYSADEVLGRDLFGLLIPSEAAEMERQSCQEAFQPGYLGSGENPILTKAGERRMIYWQCCVIGDAEQPGSMLCFGVDVTERLRAETKLRQQDAFIHGVVEGLNFSFFVVDRQYRYLAFNEVHRKDVRRLFGVDIELGMDLLSCHFDPLHRSIAKQNFDRALAGESVVEEVIVGETRYQTEQVLIEHDPVRNELGDVVGVVSVMHDVSRMRNAETEVRIMQERYKTLLEEVPAIVLVVSGDGLIRFINAFGAQTFQFKQEELLGRAVAGSILPEIESTGRKLWEFYQSVWEGAAREYHHTNENITRKGKRLWIDWSLRLGACPESGQLCWLCMGMDVTEKQRAMEMEKRKHERRRQNEILHDILSGRIPENKVVEHLTKLGLDARACLLCLAVGIPALRETQDEPSRRDAAEFALENVRTLTGGLAWDAHDCIGLLLPCSDSGSRSTVGGIRETVAKIWRKLQNSCRAETDGMGAAFKTCGEPDLIKLFFHAKSSFRFGPCLFPERPFYLWNDLGWVRLLAQDVNKIETQEYISEYLGRLLTIAGEEKRDYLLETLKKELEGKSSEAIAHEMNVHRQTVRYRMALLKTLLGEIDLKGDRRLNIAIALKLYEMQASLRTQVLEQPRS